MGTNINTQKKTTHAPWGTQPIQISPILCQVWGKIFKVHKNQQCTIPCKHIQIGFKQMQVTINIQKDFTVVHGY